MKRYTEHYVVTVLLLLPLFLVFSCTLSLHSISVCVCVCKMQGNLKWLLGLVGNAEGEVKHQQQSPEILTSAANPLS